MSRVEKNKGSYSKRPNGRYQLRYPLGCNKVSGKYETYTESFETEAECITALKDINDFVYHGGRLDDIKRHRSSRELDTGEDQTTFSEFAAEFIANREKQKVVSARTITDYKTHVKRINPYLGELPMRSITAKEIDALFAGLRSNSRKNGGAKPVSGTYAAHIYDTLSLIFDQAVTYKLIDSNPCAAVIKPKRDTKERVALSVEQVRTFLNAVGEQGLEAKSVGLVICAGSATRISEMLALTWSDFKGDKLYISKSMVKDSQKPKETKTGDVRENPCPGFLIDVLNEWRAIQQEQFAAKALRWSEDAPIVSNKKGTFTLLSVYEKWYKNNKARFGLPEDVTVHQLRHTVITMLQKDLGVDLKTTMGIGGHKTYQMLVKYAHTDDRAKREAMESLDTLIAPNSDEMKCHNCKFWGASPLDSSEGVCWVSDARELARLPRIHTCDNDKFERK